MKGPISNLFMVQGVPILEGISGGSDCTVDIFVKASIFLRASLAETTVPESSSRKVSILEGIFGADNCTDGHQDRCDYKDCIWWC